MAEASDSAVVELFARALEIERDARAAWLDATCNGDGELRREIDELLAAHHADGNDLDTSASALREIADDLWLAPLQAGMRIDGFEIEGMLASGGMGTVYTAIQLSPRRRVALKVMSAAVDAGDAQRRFARESAMLARLQHPSIAQVYGCGTLAAEGRLLPWFAMELVADARPITDHANECGLGLAQRLQLFSTVCAAVHAGHQRGIVHRDLKPANILVDGQGRPKIIDFGVAKAIDADLGLTLQTRVGQLVGTLAYMSPEQALGDSSAVDARSDVYSLGVVLFELVSGRMPHDLRGASLVSAARILEEVQPDAGALEAAGVPADCRTILLQALRKDPRDRYASAAALADDLRRFVRCEPIAARPPSAWYVFSRFARRNRLLVAAACALIVVLMLGSLGTLVGFVRAARGRDDALWGRDFLAGMLRDADPYRGKGPQVTLGDALRRATDRLEASLPRPELEEQMRGVLGETLMQLGDSAAGKRHLQRALELREALGVVEDEVSLRLRRGLLQVLANLGEHEAAERFGIDVVARHEALLARGDPARARAQLELGAARFAARRFADALAVFEAADEELRVHDEPDPELADEVRRCTGVTQWALGELARAEELLRQTVEFRRARFGDANPGTFMAMNNLGTVIGERERFDEAAALLEPALAAQEALLGKEHPETLSSVNNLATVLRKAGRCEDAASLLRRALEARRRVLGPDAQATLRTQSNLAVALLELGLELEKKPARRENLQEAESLLRDVIARFTNGSAEQSIDCARAHATLGKLLLSHERWEEARGHYEAAQRCAGALLHESRPETWVFRAGLGRALFGLGRFAEAARLLDASRDALRSLWGAEDPRLQTLDTWLHELAARR